MTRSKGRDDTFAQLQSLHGNNLCTIQAFTQEQPLHMPVLLHLQNAIFLNGHGRSTTREIHGITTSGTCINKWIYQWRSGWNDDKFCSRGKEGLLVKVLAALWTNKLA